MPRIQVVSSNTSWSVTLSSVQVGDIVVVAAGEFYGDGSNTPGYWSISDTLGNTYTKGPFGGSYSGVGNIMVWTCTVTVAGSPTITAVYGGRIGSQLLMIATQHRGDGIVDQFSRFYEGKDYTVESSPFSLANTTVITFVWQQVASPGCVSNTGDTQISNAITGNLGIRCFERTSTGPGSAYVSLTAGVGTEVLECLCVVTLSLPLDRPDGLTNQYALRAGAGLTPDQNLLASGLPQPGQGTGYINNPLNISLPYRPAIGSVLCVGVTQSINTGGLSNTFTVTDTYGNSYTPVIKTIGSSSVVIAAFVSKVQHLPAAGLIFQLSMSISVASNPNIWQSTSLAVTEVVNGNANGVLAAGFNSTADLSPTVRIISDVIPSVPAYCYLWAYGFYGGGQSQDTIAWTALDGYTMQMNWSRIQIPACPATNRARLGTSAIMDKTVVSSGGYNARMDGTITGFYDNHGSIVLLAIPLPIPNPCPDPRRPDTNLVFQDSFLQEPTEIIGT